MYPSQSSIHLYLRKCSTVNRYLSYFACIIIHDDLTRTNANSRLQFHIRNVLVDFFIHVNVLYVCLAADFGPWSEYGDCGCDSLQTRSRVCEGDSDSCVGESVESIACECVPFNAAGMMFCTTPIVLLVIIYRRSSIVFTPRMNSD